MARKQAERRRKVREKTERLQRIAELLPDNSLIRERTRSRILSVLAGRTTISFVELRELLMVSDGRLSQHISRLEKAGIVMSKKSFLNRVPRTELRLTAEGRRVFLRHIADLERLIAVARGEEEP